MENINTILENTYKQIIDDRNRTQYLYDNLVEKLEEQEQPTENLAWHLNYGMIISKYMELLTKINEQQLKLILILKSVIDAEEDNTLEEILGANNGKADEQKCF